MIEKPVRAVVVGMGALGRLVVVAAAQRTDLDVVGAADVDPAVIGTEVGDVRIVGSLAELPDADVAIHTTTSRKETAGPVIRSLLERGLSVASSCEELHGGDIALDELAASKGLRVIATGVNPGLVMDRLPALLASACVNVESIRVQRIVDLASRREALQKKMGVGLMEAEVLKRDDLGHAGLRESMSTVLAALGRRAERLDHALEAIVRDGRCVGQDEKLVAFVNARPLVELELRMEMHVVSSDEILISGDPPIRCSFEGGIQGDRATVGMLLSAALELGRAR